MDERIGKLTKAVGIARVAAGAAYLSKSENRQKVKSLLGKAFRKKDPSSYITQLGRPTDIADAKMVDEGAMTSVQYYNDLRDHYTSNEQKED